ncbi:hypothetical protein GCM10007385_39430 [Tateyamaria omphalii]|uniref:hypothetical protein n=1 Tax=Tateyamaria omphalii TaxID=299262 RepID=UPI001679F520|nr:hypothetical protein [Tateyamaria omphalii]GGX66315.1 hypothetical protein GCM10007385_39430 [Tateyamaria omphalii]
MLKKQILAAVAYPLIVFPLAIVWHLLLFKDRYMSFGYFDGEPNIAVGLASMVVQGAVLAAIYPMFQLGSEGFARAIKFAGLLGLFFWTSHVLALVAKQNVQHAGTYILMETIYLGLQFGLFALALGVIFHGAGRASIAPT